MGVIGKLIGVNTFELRSRPNINIGDIDDAVWEEYRRRQRLEITDMPSVIQALPVDARWSVISDDNVLASSATGGKPRRMRITAVDGDYFEIKKLGVSQGRMMTPQELARAGARRR